MGDVAEMMLEGTLCATCGVYLGEATGIPRYCKGCEEGDIVLTRTHWSKAKKTQCPHCQKWVKVTGINDHIRDMHTPKEPE
jgi:hypothetical protein